MTPRDGALRHVGEHGKLESPLCATPERGACVFSLEGPTLPQPYHCAWRNEGYGSLLLVLDYVAVYAEKDKNWPNVDGNGKMTHRRRGFQIQR